MRLPPRGLKPAGVLRLVLECPEIVNRAPKALCDRGRVVGHGDREREQLATERPVADHERSPGVDGFVRGTHDRGRLGSERHDEVRLCHQHLVPGCGEEADERDIGRGTLGELRCQVL